MIKDDDFNEMLLFNTDIHACTHLTSWKSICIPILKEKNKKNYITNLTYTEVTQKYISLGIEKSSLAGPQDPY